MNNAQKYIELYNQYQKENNETILDEMFEIELELNDDDVKYIESVLGEFCFC